VSAAAQGSATVGGVPLSAHNAAVTTETSWVDSMPAIYDRLLGPALFVPFAEHLAEKAASFEPHRILELAAGSGIATRALRRALPGSEITATDLNPAMVAWGAGQVGDVTWRQADAQQLDFPDSSFELVVCQFGAMFFPDRPGAFREAGRVLVPDGRMLFSVWDVAEASEFPAALVAALPDDPPSFVARLPHGYADPDWIRADLAAGGLEPEEVTRVVLSGRAASGHALAEGFCLGTPLRFALEARGRLEELTRLVGDEMTRLLGEGPLDGESAAYLVTARGPN
jgi:SAM-dependent methyltransferase